MKCVDKSNQPAPNLPSPVSAEWYYCCWSVASCGVVADWFPLLCTIRYPRYSSVNIRLHSVLETHVDWQLLNFWQKWVINITRLVIQMYTFDKIPGYSQFWPPRPKKALMKGIIEIERAVFVVLTLFPIWKGDIC